MLRGDSFRGIDRAFSPLFPYLLSTQADGLGWYYVAPLALSL